MPKKIYRSIKNYPFKGNISVKDVRKAIREIREKEEKTKNKKLFKKIYRLAKRAERKMDKNDEITFVFCQIPYVITRIHVWHFPVLDMTIRRANDPRPERICIHKYGIEYSPPKRRFPLNHSDVYWLLKMVLES